MTPGLVKACCVAHAVSLFACLFGMCQEQLDDLTELCSRLGLSDSEGNIIQPGRIFCCDETGSSVV